MNTIYWHEMVGPPQRTLDAISDPSLRRRVEVNFGPWDRMDADAPFVSGAGERPKGASFYPSDMTVDEFDAAADSVNGEALRSQYTVVRRDGGGGLEAVPYRVAFADDVLAAATFCVRLRPWRRTPACAATSSFARPPSRPTSIERATTRGWT